MRWKRLFAAIFIRNMPLTRWLGNVVLGRLTGHGIRQHLTRVAGMLFLGFSAGLPLLLVLGTLSFWLREAGVDRTTIG